MATFASSSEPIFIAPKEACSPGRMSAVLPSPAVPQTPEQTAFDAQLAAIITAPLPMGQTSLEGYRNKEIAILGALAKRSVLESRALHARLANPVSSDVLAVTFMRLTVERRVRILAFLADARRRAVVGAR
jgi:hypothetical protein